MTTFTRSAATAVAVALLTACGGGSSGPLHPATPTAPAGSDAPSSATHLPPGLLFTGPDRAEFLSVLQTGTTFSGTYTYYAYLAAAPHVSTQTVAVTGVLQGTAVQLTVGTSQLLGSLEPDGSLDLAAPQSDGSIQTHHFVPGTTDDYNTAIAPLQAQVQQWSTSYWGTQAAKACTLAVSGHDVRVFVASGGDSLCSAALNLGYTVATTYVAGATVMCVGRVLGRTVGSSPANVAVADDGAQFYGTIACNDVNAGTFPSVAQQP